MHLGSLRTKYGMLDPQERAELFFAKAIPKHDDALADALSGGSLYDVYQQHIAEFRIILFGSYWMSKLYLLCGLRLGKVMSEIHNGSTGSESDRNDEDMFEERGAALALALKEFDDEHGGWLQGIVALLNGEEIWEFSLQFGEFLADVDAPLPFFKHLAEYREELKSMWEDMTFER